ncbi:MAG TPA: ABC transporter permease [Candidatus Acidoferrales bacterium]|nr:ABC transporter permease [Candidatus Acidoferrales bacterium]
MLRATHQRLAETFRRLRVLLRGRRFERELADEMRLHQELCVRERMEKWEVSPDDSRYAAQRQFGNALQLREESHDMWGWTWLEHIAQDFRYGLRMLRKNAVFTGVAVLTLALGIGANTVIFTVVNAVVLHPLPYKDSERLVVVRERIPEFGKGSISMPPVDVQEMQAKNAVFADSAAFETIDLDLSSDMQVARVRASRVTASLFPLLGASPALGRTFTAEEDRQAQHVAVVSFALWQSALGGRLDVLGRTIHLDRKPYQVIGVMPASFQFPPPTQRDPGMSAIWIPMSYTAGELAGRDWFDFDLIARLKPGITAQQAESNVGAISAAMYSWMARERSDLAVSAVVAPLRGEVVGKARSLLLLLLGAIFLVLLIACANIASLLLSRSAVRRREIAVRIALGATRARLARLSLLEDVLLALLGGAAGLLLARWGVSLFVALMPPNIPRIQPIQLDARVLAFTFTLTLITGLLFGLVPAISMTRVNLNETLKEGGRSNTASTFWKNARGVIVCAQMALALVLLIGGSLLVRSFLRVQEIDPGFRPSHMLTMSVYLAPTQYAKQSDVQTFYRRLLDRVSALPGVTGAAAATDLPLRGSWQRVFEAAGHPKPATANLQLIANTAVLGGYFEALGIPLRAGRFFTGQDAANAPPTVIISESMARQYWPGENPVGQQLRYSPTLPWMTIVGVVGDVKQGPLDTETRPHTYQPFTQMGEDCQGPRCRSLSVILKTAADPQSLARAVQSQVQALDPQEPVSDVRTMEEIVDRSLVSRRFNTMLFAGFASIALLLAAAGIYGVIAYSVSQRTQEIGIRMALGANVRAIVWLTLRDGLRFAAIGIALGLPAAFAATRFVSSLLFDVRPADPLTFLAVIAILVAVSLFASYVPARRATRIDPLAALRHN